MSLRCCRLLTLALLLAALAACGDDDVTPPPDTDGGTTDAGPRDGAADGGVTAADGGACTDEDGDGHGALPCGDDCDDTDATRFPGNAETCDADDDDCNDSTYGPDADADGFPSITCCNGADNCGADCNDSAVNANPDADEICNGGIDDDCNGLADLADGVCVPCGAGYTGFDRECTDVDECVTGAPCGGALGTTCTNTDGSYTCGCPTGYGAPATSGTCTDVDECAADVCGPGRATCTNTVGSYACTCAAGYTVAAASGAPCVDVDECARVTMAPCVPGGTCRNVGGSYACTCNAGYAVAPATGGTCSDLDECMLGTDDCDESPAATCANAVGSFTCICPPGVGGTGRGAAGCAGPRFTDLGDGTVRDNRSGLEWQQGVSLTEQNQAASVAYCTSLALDGGGWRLPTIDELRSIVDDRFFPRIDPSFFPGTPSTLFWSSSPVAGSPSNGWAVYFDNGHAYNADATYMSRARCVR